MKEIGMMFTTPMIQAIEDDRKRVTRRIIKPQPPEELQFPYGFITGSSDKRNIGKFCWTHGKVCDNRTHIVSTPCQPGDIIWCRESAMIQSMKNYDKSVKLIFKADNRLQEFHVSLKLYEQLYQYPENKWLSPYWFTREAARLFLTVKDVHPEKLQDITGDDVIEEGIKLSCRHDNYVCSAYPCDFKNTYACKDYFKDLWDSLYAAPRPIKKRGIITHYESYPWEDVQEIREYKGKPWIVYGNPWIFKIEFERKVET
jgi:hypothetical protein